MHDPISRLISNLRASRTLSTAQLERMVQGIALSRHLSDKPKTIDEVLRKWVATAGITFCQRERLRAGQPYIVGEYRILDSLATDVFFKSYRTERISTGQEAVLNIVQPPRDGDGKWMEALERSVDAAATVAHENLIGIREVGVRSGEFYVATQYEEGDLLNHRRQRTSHPIEVALTNVLQVAEALAHVHAQGLVHGDVRPSNLLLSNEGHLRVINLGLSRFQVERLVQDDLSSLPPAYNDVFDFVAPEVVRQRKVSGPRADIYSLGCVLFWQLAGKACYRGATVADKVRVHREEPLPVFSKVRDDIPEEVESLFHRMIAKDPSDRFQNMDEVIFHLKALLASEEDASSEQTVSLAAGKRRGVRAYSFPKVTRQTALALGLTATAIFSAIVAILAYVGGRSFAGEDPPTEKITTAKLVEPASIPVSIDIRGRVADVDLNLWTHDQEAVETGQMLLAVLSFVIDQNLKADRDGYRRAPSVAELRRIGPGDIIIDEHEPVVVAATELDRVRGFIDQGERVEIVSINLSNTPIKDDDLEFLVETSNLKWLTLENCPFLTDACCDHFSELRHLHFVDLRGTYITAAGLATLPTAPLQVIMLDAHSGQMDGSIVPVLVARFGRSLTAISLDGIPLNEMQFRMLGRLANLKELTVTGSEVSSEWLQYIRSLDALESLDLSGNARVDDASLQHFVQMQRLARLNLDDTSVQSREIFQQQLGCKIVWD